MHIHDIIYVWFEDILLEENWRVFGIARAFFLFLFELRIKNVVNLIAFFIVLILKYALVDFA